MEELCFRRGVGASGLCRNREQLLDADWSRVVTWRLIGQELLDEGGGGAEDLARRRQLVVGVVGLHHQREAVGVGP